jgi:hypothetical protein
VEQEEQKDKKNTQRTQPKLEVNKIETQKKKRGSLNKAS